MPDASITMISVELNIMIGLNKSQAGGGCYQSQQISFTSLTSQDSKIMISHPAARLKSVHEMKQHVPLDDVLSLGYHFENDSMSSLILYLNYESLFHIILNHY